jgi:glycosyltransferase involved in cell wall biosynthesis
MLKLSIIIPHYNSKTTLITLLDSIPNEEWIQTIVIDDNSNFDIFKPLEKYEHVDVFKVDKNKKGAGAARNLGLKNAIGDYILFADADDFFTENAFEIIKKEIVTKMDVVYFTPTSINIKTGQLANRHKSTCLLIEDYLKNKNKEVFFKSYGPCSKLIANELIIKNSIEFEEIITSDDVIFSLMVAFHSTKIKAVKEIIYIITDSDNSLTKQKDEIYEDVRFETMTRYNDFLKNNNLSKYQGAMYPHLKNSWKFSPLKFLHLFFYCKYKKYPIFYDLKHLLRILKK